MDLIKICFSILSLLGALLFSGQVSAKDLNLADAEEFQFLHCQPLSAVPTDLVVHYIIEMDNYRANTLYIGAGRSGIKAIQLKNLAQVQEQLVETTQVGEDLGFSSGQMWLRFSLEIKDSDGQYLEGLLHDKSQTVPIKCQDITLEQ